MQVKETPRPRIHSLPAAYHLNALTQLRVLAGKIVPKLQNDEFQSPTRWENVANQNAMVLPPRTQRFSHRNLAQFSEALKFRRAVKRNGRRHSKRNGDPATVLCCFGETVRLVLFCSPRRDLMLYETCHHDDWSHGACGCVAAYTRRIAATGNANPMHIASRASSSCAD